MLILFLTRSGLDKECSKRCIPYNENMHIDSNSSSSLSVVRCGEIEYGGMVSWKKYVAVLTNFGFLHLFTKKKSETGYLHPLPPKGSSPEQEKTSQDSAENEDQEKPKESNDTSNNSNGTGAKEGNGHFTLIPTEDPYITVPVTRCKMIVTESKIIRMTHVLPGTFFNSTVVHDIRFDSIDDLVAWMIDLRNFMSPVTSK